MENTRFDDRRVLSAIIADLRGKGFDLDDLDVHLSRFGPVDLDLLHECLLDCVPAPAAEFDYARAA